MKRAVFLFSLGTLLLLTALWSAVGSALAAPALPASLSGTVVDINNHPIAGVTVQVQGTTNQTTTAKNGSFTLRGITWEKAVTLTAYTPNYMVGWVALDPKAKDWKGVPSPLTITMKSLPERDNFLYPWFSFEGVTGSASCGLCHREYEEWQRDAHSQAAQNPRFLSIYQGTNLDGKVGQRTTYNAEGKANLPDPKKPYYGPGYKLDEPMRDGNCATCHTPMAEKISNKKNCGWSGCHTTLTSERATTATMDAGVSPLHLTGDAAEGISCDFCHKVGDVILDPKTNLPKADMPGILSMKLYRPAEGQQVFFGTFGDVARRVSYAPIESKSEFCAPCHYGVFGGVVGSGSVSGGVLIYNSYGEWLESPYSDPVKGKTCQDCHMKVLDTKVSVFPEKGGIERDYVELHDHYMPGAADKQLLENSVTMQVTSQRKNGSVELQVKITNDQTGHHIPTDAPMREMILVVEARDAKNKPLVLSTGPVLPEWAGSYAGQPGKDFAKILQDEWTGEMPTAAYWRPVKIALDTRLAAMATDTSRYTFQLPAGSKAQIRVKLVFRRAFQELAQQKGWTDPDILMEQEIIQVEK